MENWLENPEEILHSPDLRHRRSAIARMAAIPQPYHRGLFEECLLDSDPVSALLAYQGLKRLFPHQPALDSAWKELFGESVDLLKRRAASGPLQLRLAALQALAFAPIGLTSGVAEYVLESMTCEQLEGSLSEQPPVMSLVNDKSPLDLPEGFALLLTALPDSPARTSFLKKELTRRDPERVLPVLLTIQLMPVSELTDDLLEFIRFSEASVAIEAARALFACAGPRVFLVLSTLVHETTDPRKLAQLLPLLGQTCREEVWPILASHLTHPIHLVRQAAVSAAAAFPIETAEKVTVLAPLLRDPHSEVVTEAARCLWRMGSLEALPRLEKLLNQGSPAEKALAASAIGQLPPSVCLPLLIDSLTRERHGDTVREILLALRRLLPRATELSHVHDQLLLALKRQLEVPDPFLRSQAAVLCGSLGSPAEDMVLSALEREENPHVLASLLGAMGKIGNPRLLVIARFNDHPDPRVRANLMDALLPAGISAVPYLAGALKDPSPRVRAAAARGLFLLGQIDVVATLNRMLLVPSPLPVLSASYALGRLMRITPPALTPSHPVTVALGRLARKTPRVIEPLPPLLRNVDLAGLFQEMARVGPQPLHLVPVLERTVASNSGIHASRRLLAAMLMTNHQSAKALEVLEECLQNFPTILADQFDAYRLSLTLGDLPRADRHKAHIIKNYAGLREACLTLCHDLRGSGTEDILSKLHQLQSPSLNLYNAMIQLKTLQGEHDTVLDLLSELILARPANVLVVQILAALLPESCRPLKEALTCWAQKLSEEK